MGTEGQRVRGAVSSRVRAIGAGGFLLAIGLSCAPLMWGPAAPPAAPLATTAGADAGGPEPYSGLHPATPDAFLAMDPDLDGQDAGVVDASGPAVVAGESDPGNAPAPELRIERGLERLPLLVPNGEELEFEVEIDLGALGDPTVGRVTLSSGVEPYFAGLPSATNSVKRTGQEVGWIKSTARGDYLGYVLDHELYVRHLPRAMPSMFLKDTQRGSENRQRELKIGVVDGKTTCVYRHDGHCKGCDNREHFIESKWVWGKPSHCDKCKRMEHRKWRDPVERTAPEGTVDMLSAVYLARSMVRTGAPVASFPLVDKQKLWQVNLARGRRKQIEVPAGRFDCIEVRLTTAIPQGEPDDGEGFQGLFGIQGSIQIWLEASTGVPILIAGTLPVPVLGDLDVRVELKSAKGTPAGFPAGK